MGTSWADGEARQADHETKCSRRPEGPTKGGKDFWPSACSDAWQQACVVHAERTESAGQGRTTASELQAITTGASEPLVCLGADAMEEVRDGERPIDHEMRMIRELTRVHSETTLELLLYAQQAMAYARETVDTTHRIMATSEETRARSAAIRRDPFRP